MPHRFVEAGPARCLNGKKWNRKLRTFSVYTGLMPQPALRQPLTDDEIEELGNFLLDANHGNAMTIDELDGFFCALICGPEVVPPSEYMPVVWRGQTELSGIFASVEEANHFLSSMMRLWNTIAGTLAEGEPYKPLIFDEDLDGVASATRWAVGFQQGMALRADAWAPLIRDQKASILLMPFLELAGDDGPVPGTVPVEIPEVMREMLLFGLMAGIPAIYDYMRVGLRPTRKKAAKKKSAKKKPVAKPAGSRLKAAETKAASSRKPAVKKPKRPL